MATLGAVSADAIAMLDELLTRRIGTCHGRAALSMGGPREAAAIINGAGRAVEKRIMPAITRTDKALAKAIEQEMFRFEHLYVLDTMAMGALLREVENDTLVVALKGIVAAERTPFLAAMSGRAGRGHQRRNRGARPGEARRRDRRAEADDRHRAAPGGRRRDPVRCG